MLVYLLIAALLSFVICFILFFKQIFNKAEANASVLEERLHSGFLFYDFKPIFLIYYAVVGFLLFYTIIFVTDNKVPFGVVLVLLLGMPTLAIKIYNKQRLDKIEKQIPDALMMVSGGLKAGASLNTAFQQLALEFPLPFKQEISMVVREQKLGVSLDDAMQHLQKRVPLNSIVLVVTAIRISNETGGELAEALSRTASTLKQMEQAEGKIKALTAQGKMQAWVVGAMPLGLMFVLSKMEPEAMGHLWTTVPGWIALGAIALLEFLGVWLILKIVNIDV